MVVITGASSGIGESNGEALYRITDITKNSEVEDLIKLVVDMYGKTIF